MVPWEKTAQSDTKVFVEKGEERGKHTQRFLELSIFFANKKAWRDSPTPASHLFPCQIQKPGTTALQATTTTTSTDNNNSSSSIERDLFPSLLKNALKGIEIVARGNPIEQEELGAGGVCDMLVQLLTKAAVDHMNLAEGDPPFLWYY